MGPAKGKYGIQVASHSLYTITNSNKILIKNIQCNTKAAELLIRQLQQKAEAARRYTDERIATQGKMT